MYKQHYFPVPLIITYLFNTLLSNFPLPKYTPVLQYIHFGNNIESYVSECSPILMSCFHWYLSYFYIFFPWANFLVSYLRMCLLTLNLESREELFIFPTACLIKRCYTRNTMWDHPLRRSYSKDWSFLKMLKPSKNM